MNGQTFYTQGTQPDRPVCVAAHGGPERIWCACLRLDGQEWAAECHMDATRFCSDRTGQEVKAIWASAEQGFLTTRGRFLSRADAWLLAERERQVGPEVVVRGELHSEDLASGHYADLDRGAA